MFEIRKRQFMLQLCMMMYVTNKQTASVAYIHGPCVLWLSNSVCIHLIHQKMQTVQYLLWQLFLSYLFFLQSWLNHYHNVNDRITIYSVAKWKEKKKHCRRNRLKWEMENYKKETSICSWNDLYLAKKHTGEHSRFYSFSLNCGFTIKCVN